MTYENIRTSADLETFARERYHAETDALIECATRLEDAVDDFRQASDDVDTRRILARRVRIALKAKQSARERADFARAYYFGIREANALPC